jgi:cytochrome bd ubiquinol oxidase subunit II
MFELWFGIVAVMFTLYVVLDGYDLGAGALHLVLARTNDERRTVLASIGPFWDANEVWLLAAAGALFAAFPRVLASGLSGFYIAIFLVVWCLILRAIAIEFRSHLGDPLWRGFWDVTLCLASALLAVLFGAALGNIIRGVPLDADGWFRLTLFTTFRPNDPAGLLDWFTVLAGVFSLVALAAHGAAFLAWRASGEVAARARRMALVLYTTLAALWPLTTVATHAVNPALLAAVPGRPLAWLGLALAAGGIGAALAAGARGRPLAAFLGSCAFLTGMLVATAACMFPVMLRSWPEPARSITAYTGGATAHGLRISLGWWAIGFPIAALYFVTLFRIHRGRAVAARDGEGY